MSAKPEKLWIAVMFNGLVRVGEAVFKGDSFAWELGSRRLEVLCLGGDCVSYAEAQISIPGRDPEMRRLLFEQNNCLDVFKVRVYRGEITEAAAREDFYRPIQPAVPQGMA